MVLFAVCPPWGAAAAARKDGAVGFALVVGEPVGDCDGGAGAGIDGALGALNMELASEPAPARPDRPTPMAVRVTGSQQMTS